MSLDDAIDGDYNSEIVPRSKKRGKGPNFEIKNIFTNKSFLIFIAGLIIGLILGYYLLNGLIEQNYKNELMSNITEKNLLKNENNCLYKLVPNPKEAINNCVITIKSLNADKNQIDTN
ncbi:MAG: hypothetical protein PHQ98_00040 [Candidatus ainarchaeum sp.]|nr:hypothetical protein [Candidatus ainarchaeum sp.]